MSPGRWQFGMTACLLALALQLPAAHAASLGQDLAGKRILHVAAHPDDETVFAPLMAEACRFNGATCHMVVAMDARNWGCLRTLKLRDFDKCAAMRRMETAASAANLNATHEFYGWEERNFNWNDEGVRHNIAALERAVGGHEAVVARFRKTLDEFRPDMVLAFDPRHGTTCHPHHRATVLLALEAIAGLPQDRRPEVLLDSDIAPPAPVPEGLKSVIEGFGVVRWPGDAAPVTWYDANVVLPDGRTGFDYAVDALRLNATQFPEVATGKVTPAPPAEYRRVPIVRLEDIDPHQQGLCEAMPATFHKLESMSEEELIRMLVE